LGVSPNATPDTAPVGKYIMNRATATFNDSPETWPDTQTGAEPPLAAQLLTVHDAARFLNVTVSWIYEHTREEAEDRLPFLKLGKYVRFDRTDLREYVNAKRRASRARYGRR
jgi:excisionase family DNA binding protein